MNTTVGQMHIHENLEYLMQNCENEHKYTDKVQRE